METFPVHTGAVSEGTGSPFLTEMQLPCPFPSTYSACPLWGLSNLPEP